MIRHTTCDRVTIFQGVETVHFSTGGIDPTLIGEVFDCLTRNWVKAQEIAIQTENSQGFAETHKSFHPSAQDFLVGTLLTFIASRFVAKELCLRVSHLQFTQKAMKRR
jgi:hypothetical protein